MSAARIDATTHTVTTLPLPTEHVEVSSEGTFVRDAKGPPLGVEGGTLWYTVVDIDAVVYDPDVGSHVVTADSRFTDGRVIAVDTAGGAVRSVPIGDAAVDDLAATTDAMWVLAATLRVGPGSSLTRIELSRLP